MQWARALLPFSGRATAVLIGAYALASLAAAAPSRVVDSPAGAEVEIAARRARNPKSWFVRVDGWYIEVDGVRGDARQVHSPSWRTPCREKPARLTMR